MFLALESERFDVSPSLQLARETVTGSQGAVSNCADLSVSGEQETERALAEGGIDSGGVAGYGEELV